MCKKKIQIDFKYPYFGGIGYREELVVFVQEGIASPEEREVQITENKSISGNPIEITDDSRTIEIRFDNVFAYHVMEESYGGLPNYEENIDQFMKQMHVPEKAKHYEIYTEDVVVNVVSFVEPRIVEQKK